MFIFLLGYHSNSFSQNNELNYLIELNSNISTQETLPFWLTTNKFGAVPNSNNLMLSTGIFQDFIPFLKSSKINFSYGAQITGTLASENELIVNQLYGSLKWKKLQLDLGVKHKEVLFEGLSSSNGDFTFSTNARSIPGINLKLTDYVKLPFAKSWLTIKGDFGEYLLNDKRAVDKAHVHQKSLFFKSKLNNKLELITGINHYAMWAGTSEQYGKQPSSFKDYIRVIIGKSGGESANQGDQINALGNHLGNYLIQLNKKGEKTDWSFYWLHPFEDTSGREFKNIGDGTFGLFFDLLKPNALLNHINFEFTFTKDQGKTFSNSGLIDNYFSNKIYESGWTYQNNTIGSPFFPTGINDDGYTNIERQYNRFAAYHLGFDGSINSKISYKTLLSYVTYFGGYSQPFENKPELFASLVELNYANEKLPFNISLGLSADFGDFRDNNNFGGFLKISKRGKF